MIVFGVTPGGEPVHKLTLGDGTLSVSVLTWGAIVQDVRLQGVPYSLTLGTSDLADYLGALAHHGALIGPVANRISTGRIRIDGMMYELERNQDGRIHLHSGAQATHRRLWQVADHGPDHATLTCALPDGLCGLPGNRRITADFRVANAALTLDITGTTDMKTPMNFANHSYWNLDGSDTFAGHQLWIDAQHYLPTTADFTPTGEIRDVTGTPMDFRNARRIDPATDALDHNFCLSTSPQPVRCVLTLRGQSGVGLTLATDQTGLQVYDNRRPARPGRQFHEGLALEAQSWPDAPNHPGFPSIMVTPDRPYRQTTRFLFSRR